VKTTDAPDNEHIEREGDLFLGMGNSFELAPGEDAHARVKGISNELRSNDRK
jgi:hypothetical protein